MAGTGTAHLRPAHERCCGSRTSSSSSRPAAQKVHAVSGISLDVRRGRDARASSASRAAASRRPAGRSCSCRAHVGARCSSTARPHRPLGRAPAPGAPRAADDLPGPDLVAEPAPEGRATSSAEPLRIWGRGSRRSRRPRSASARRRRPRPRRRRSTSGPHQFSGGPVPAHLDRPGARARARPDHLRRAGVGARRVGAGADPQPARGHEGPLRPHAGVHRPRPGGGEERQRPGGGHVPRQALRGRRPRRAVRRPAHPYTAALLASIPVPDPDVRPDDADLLAGDLPVAGRPPVGLPVPHPLPAGPGRAAPARSRRSARSGPTTSSPATSRSTDPRHGGRRSDAELAPSTAASASSGPVTSTCAHGPAAEQEQHQLLGAALDAGRSARCPSPRPRRSPARPSATPGALDPAQHQRRHPADVGHSAASMSGRSRGPAPVGPAHVLVVDEPLVGVEQRPQAGQRATGRPAGPRAGARPAARSPGPGPPSMSLRSSPANRSPPRIAGAARGSCSRTTRWAARSSVVHPSHRVGASGPVATNRSHSSARSVASRGCSVTAVGYAAMASPPAFEIDERALYEVTIATDKGDIVLELDPKLAPNTVNNFVALARQGFYDNVTFHRVVPGVRHPGRRPRGVRAGRSRLQVRRRAGEGRVHARRGGHGQRRARHQRLAVLHLHRRLHPQARQGVQPVRLRHLGLDVTGADRARATSCAR